MAGPQNRVSFLILKAQMFDPGRRTSPRYVPVRGQWSCGPPYRIVLMLSIRRLRPRDIWTSIELT